MPIQTFPNKTLFSLSHLSFFLCLFLFFPFLAIFLFYPSPSHSLPSVTAQPSTHTLHTFPTPHPLTYTHTHLYPPTHTHTHTPRTKTVTSARICCFTCSSQRTTPSFEKSDLFLIFLRLVRLYQKLSRLLFSRNCGTVIACIIDRQEVNFLRKCEMLKKKKHGE